MAELSYLWAFSSISKSTLQGNSAYNIENFTWQSDQTAPILGWKPPQRKGTTRPKLGRYPQNLDTSQRGDGFWEFVWCLPPMTPLMFKFILDNQFGSGVQFAPATVQTFDESINDYNAFQVTANRPVYGQDYDIQDEMFIDVKYRFTGGVLL